MLSLRFLSNTPRLVDKKSVIDNYVKPSIPLSREYYDYRHGNPDKTYYNTSLQTRLNGNGSRISTPTLTLLTAGMEESQTLK